MSNTVTDEIGKFSHHYPKVATILTASSQGRQGAMTAAWHSSISFRPPLYGVAVAPERFTYKLIAESREFGINFLPFEKASLAAAIGGTSGHKMNKFERLSIQTESPLKTAAPILKDAYAAYECKLIDSKTYGDHLWIVGEIVAVHFLSEAFTPGETLDLDKVKPLLYLGSDFYVSTDRDTVSFVKRGI